MLKNSKIIIFFLLAILLVTMIFWLNTYTMQKSIILEKENELTNSNNQNIQLAKEIDSLNLQVNTLTEENASLNEELRKSEYELANTIVELQELSKSYEELHSNYKSLEERSIYVYNGNWDYKYTDEDLTILAGVIYGENYVSGRWEMMLTGSVVLNRVLSDKFPNTIKDVVYQFDGEYEQYAPRTKRLIGSSEIPEVCYKLAKLLLEYGPVAPEFLLYQAHRNQGKIYWEWEGEEFCYK